MTVMVPGTLILLHFNSTVLTDPYLHLRYFSFIYILYNNINNSKMYLEINSEFDFISILLFLTLFLVILCAFVCAFLHFYTALIFLSFLHFLKGQFTFL